jgi:hypothetical protein
MVFRIRNKNKKKKKKTKENNNKNSARTAIICFSGVREKLQHKMRIKINANAVVEQRISLQKSFRNRFAATRFSIETIITEPCKRVPVTVTPNRFKTSSMLLLYYVLKIG